VALTRRSKSQESNTAQIDSTPDANKATAQPSSCSSGAVGGVE